MMLSNIPRLAILGLLSTVLALPLVKRQTYRRTNNYSGVAIQGAPDGAPFTYVASQINLADTIYVNSESSPGNVQTAASWVGFGAADPGTQAILQTGCSVFNDGQEDTWARCWYEYFPAPPVFLDNNYGFTASIGDTVNLELTRTSDTTGHATVTNLNTGQVVDVDITAPDGTSTSGYDVEWVVEDPRAKTANLFVDFQKEFFEGCSATTSAGGGFGPGDANLIYNEWKDLGDGNGPSKWTNSFVPSDSEVEVDWVSQYS